MSTKIDLNIVDKIVEFYKSKESSKKKTLDFVCDHITNLNSGLGDTLSISHLPKLASEQDKNVYIYSGSHHFGQLLQFNPWYVPTHENNFVRAEVLQGHYDCGNGHFFQRLQRACGLIPELKPKPTVIRVAPQVKNTIALCLSVGAHAQVQKQTIHPRARELYPECRVILQEFINDNLDKYEFFEIGTEFSGLENVENRCGLQLTDSIIELNRAEYFIGLHSGVMHLAAALDIKSIILINFPNPKDIFLPILKDVDIIDIDWMEPQNVYLHMDEDGPLVKYFNRENLERAISGDAYPFWNDSYLDLINYRF